MMNDVAAQLQERVAVLESQIDDLRAWKQRTLNDKNNNDNVRLVIPQRWVLITIAALVMVLMGADLELLIDLIKSQ